MLRWALAIRPGSTWHEAKVQQHPKNGFTLQAWNRKLQAKPTVTVMAKDAGLKAEGEVLQVRLNGPAFRLPSEVEVSWTAHEVSLIVNRPVNIRLDYGVLCPEWGGKNRPVLQRRSSGGAADIVRSDVVWNGNAVEWQATPGEYQLLMVGK
jgi:hypothetical protein